MKKSEPRIMVGPRLRNSPTINNKRRSSLPRELPRPVSAKASDKERTNTPHYKS